MNLKYLGDALDHWKGSLFECLQAEGALHNFAVDPMATDGDQWNDADFSVLARLLRIKCDQIIQHREFLIRARDLYFREIVHGGDIFLDPDTGIATAGCKQIQKYVTPLELASLLRHVPGRIVAVYQHVRAQSTCVRVKGCRTAIASKIERFGWCSYESPTVAMLFLCDRDSRTREIENALTKLLGRHAEQRVRSGSMPETVAAVDTASQAQLP